jgi:hypothetical protein
VRMSVAEMVMYKVPNGDASIRISANANSQTPSDKEMQRSSQSSSVVRPLSPPLPLSRSLSRSPHGSAGRDRNEASTVPSLPSFFLGFQQSDRGGLGLGVQVSSRKKRREVVADGERE